MRNCVILGFTLDIEPVSHGPHPCAHPKRTDRVVAGLTEGVQELTATVWIPAPKRPAKTRRRRCRSRTGEIERTLTIRGYGNELELQAQKWPRDD
jgi:hypothetical protein